MRFGYPNYFYALQFWQHQLFEETFFRMFWSELNIIFARSSYERGPGLFDDFDELHSAPSTVVAGNEAVIQNRNVLTLVERIASTDAKKRLKASYRELRSMYVSSLADAGVPREARLRVASNMNHEWETHTLVYGKYSEFA